jgi:hypothetical protein
MKTNSKWATVEENGKLYLFTPHTIEDYEATKGYISSRPVPGKPLSREDCIRLASSLLRHATR